MIIEKYIYARPLGYAVEVSRLGVRYRASVSGGHTPAALARARELRDRFLRLAGEVQARSNTGVIGVSELVKWKRSIARAAFSVSYTRPCATGRAREGKRLFYFGQARPREAALKLAIQFRQQHAPAASIVNPKS